MSDKLRGGTTIGGYMVWHSGNMGPLSGLNADLLDGEQGTHFLDWNNFSSTPTTLAGYGITDASLSSHNHDADYVELTGDSMSGNLIVNARIGIGTTPNNNLGTGSSIALGDGDTGFKQNGDGILECWTNNQEIWQANTTEFAVYKNIVGSGTITGTTITGTAVVGSSTVTVGTSGGTQGVLTLWGSTAGAKSEIKTTNGNLHIDSEASDTLYLNYYSGTGGTIFGNGAGAVSGANVSSGGVITATSFSGPLTGNVTGDVTGNADTATNVAYSGLTGTVPTWNQSTTGNAATATVSTALDGNTLSNLNTAVDNVGYLQYQTWTGGATNEPASVNNANGILTMSSHSGPYGRQIAFQDNEELWTRKISNNVYGTWRKIWNSGNDGAGSGLDADTLDGEHGSFYAPIASPALTGTPTAPTAAVATNTTQLATTAFVLANSAGGGIGEFADDAVLINSTGSYSVYAGLGTNSALVAIGYDAGKFVNSGWGNVAIGWEAGLGHSTNGLGGDDNICIGYHSGFSISAGYNSLYLGGESGKYQTFSVGSVYVGYRAGYGDSASLGDNYYNSGVGVYALNSVTTGGRNTALGAEAGFGLETGGWNTFIGFSSGGGDGDYNTAIGTDAGDSLSTGSRNLILGYNSGSDVTSHNDQLRIANNTTTTLIKGDFALETLEIDADLTVTKTITELSAKRFKENIEPLTGSLERVSKLQGVSYNKKGQTIKEIGLIAEEVEKHAPEYVSYTPEGEVNGLHYSRMVADLIEAVKELKEEVNELKRG